ncbi:hypothetical protein GCM10007939_22300 [Amylibacter marinus]|uniref:Protein kinase domain-containing protein n=1 Tax=Amylibacter marinus TaxID=1475483 RepID=A0ABQ5VXH9_9RHOB|nr:hypothetical protein [Amylibacter marinus]GLQ35946.1 hypothetical protein GCM10007939_22300 [Amylibacter marinus]
MSDLSGALHDILSQEFEYDRAQAYEFGWCTIVEAEDRLSRRPVRIYVPRDDVWANGNAKKIIRTQFKDYFKEALHECLPEAIELIEGKNAGGSMFLVTRRSSEKNMMASERRGEGVDWAQNDKFSMPEKLGAMRKLVQAVNILHEFGMIHGALGHQTLSCIRESETLLLQVDLLNFGDIAAEEPAQSLFFEPAFTAPEVFDGGSEPPQQKDKESDVYSLGKFILYFLMGPAPFIQFFTSDEEASDDPREISGKLTDHILWTNLAHSDLELDAGKLSMLTGEKISPEISEFMNYAVSMDKGVRPDDAEILYHGLMTIMGGDISDVGVMEVPTGAARSGGGGGTNPLLIGGIAAAVLVLAGGGFMLMQSNAKKKALEAQYAATGAACSTFGQNVASLKESRVTSLSDWANVEFFNARISENGKDEAKLLETQGYCEKGNAEVNKLRGDLIALFKSDIQNGIDNSVEEGTDFSALSVDDILASAADAEKARKFDQIEVLLGGLADEINQQRNTAFVSGLEQATLDNEVATQLLQSTKQSSEEKGLLSRVRNVAPLAISSENLAKKKAALSKLQAFDLKRLTKAGDERFSATEATLAALDKADAGDANIGFKDASDAFAELKAAGLPEQTAGFVGFFNTLSGLDASLGQMSSHMEGLAAELPRLTQNIESALETANKNKWIDEPQIATLSSQFVNRESFSTYKDWSILSKISGSLAGEMDKLEAQWAEGQSACNAMMSSIEGVNGIENTKIWAELSSILNHIKSVDTANMVREDFQKCETGYGLAKRGNIELDARELLEEIKVTEAGLKEDGVGFFIPEYTFAVSEYEDLKEVNIPHDQTSYDDYASKAYAVIANLDKASDAFAAAQATNGSLQGQYDALVTDVSASPLASHPEYIKVAATLAPADANILEKNASLTDAIAAVQSLITRFDAGELINCAFDAGYTLHPVILSDEQLIQGSDAVKKAALDAGIALPANDNTSLGFCIDSKPVTMAEMQTFNDSLRPQQGDIKTEIANVQEGAAGTAVNISYWLARRYAEYVSKTVQKPVCVAPAVATVLAKSQSGEAISVPVGELFSDACGAESAIGKNLVLNDIGGEINASCVSNNSLRPKLGFRIAAGDICAQSAQ